MKEKYQKIMKVCDWLLEDAKKIQIKGIKNIKVYIQII